jgi:RimJ/RimL family protein N-acetyltransferase
MKQYFIKCTLEDIKDMVLQYAQSLSSPIDSFLEDHILESEHFMVMIDDEKAGYFSIFKNDLLTQFYMETKYRALGQKIFFKIKRMNFLQNAFVPTCDEFFMAHALDEYRSIERQAYFFQDIQNPINEEEGDSELTLRLATVEDKEDILKYSGDFFDVAEKSIAKEQIYIAVKGDKIVGFGNVEKGRVLKNYISIGMFTVEEYRQKGIGTSILLALKDMVYREGKIPIAGCWYYNHQSKKTLEKAGMYSATRLLKVQF